MKILVTQSMFCAMLLLVSLGAYAGDKNVIHKKTSVILERMASHSASDAEFGNAVKKQALLAAAKEFRKGAVRGRAVKFNVTVVVTELPPKHGNLPDACFETCLDYGQSSALTCYINCNAPKP